MENASKAIIITGGVLIALMLISVAVIMWNNGKVSVIAIEQKKNKNLIDEQNIEFASYLGKTFGSDLQNCIRKAVSQNEDNLENIITVNIKFSDDTEESYSTMKDILDENGVNILPQKRSVFFKGTIKTRENGTIEEINFEEITDTNIASEMEKY